jgi:tRNA A-37 threonylcarbamoyl transferase component Bud32
MRVDRVLGGRYRLIRPIAKGGMAEVWEGYDDVLSRAVAVKMLQPHLATDESLVERFRREAIAAARLTHPGVVATYDTGTDGGTAWIVMELIRGDTLRQLLTERGPMDPPMAVDIAGQIADALAHAHRAGLVHRDIKPANVLLLEEDAGPPRAKVTDFGIAKATEGIGLDLTRTGMVLGTPKYLSPEQVEGLEPDARADLYSLGVVLFEMLTCRVPFEGPTDMATAIAHVRQPAPRVSSLRPDVPLELDQLVADLLAKDPAARVPSAVALRQALARIPLGKARPAVLPERPPFPRPPMRPFIPSAPPLGAGNGHGPGPGPGPGGPVSPGAGGRPGPPSRPGVPRAGGGSVGGGSVGGGGLGNAPVGVAGTVGGPSPFPGSPTVVGGGGPGRPSGLPRGGDPNGTSVTRFEGANASPTGLLEPGSAPVAAPKRRRRRRRWLPGLVVAAIIVAGCVVGFVLLDNGSLSNDAHLPKLPHIPGITQTTTPVSISAVDVWMNVLGHTPDNPGQTSLTFDGNPATAWNTDYYSSATFGGLYTGEGLAIQLDGKHTLHNLTVTTPSTGWAASVYVSNSEPANGQPVTAWGSPTDSKTNVDGSTTFSLGGKSGSWVLLWLTDLGPTFHAEVAEVKVS